LVDCKSIKVFKFKLYSWWKNSSGEYLPNASLGLNNKFVVYPEKFNIGKSSYLINGNEIFSGNSTFDNNWYAELFKELLYEISNPLK